MLKRLLCVLLLLPLLCAALPAQATTAVFLPDQKLTLVVGGSLAPKRKPGTVVQSYHGGDMDIITISGILTSAPSECISGNKAGATTVMMLEYDTATDMMYYTPVHVTVVPNEPLGRRTIIRYGKNSPDVQKYIKPGEHVTVPIGTVIHVEYVDMDTGEQQPCTFTTSNTDVATIDQTGAVTTRYPGLVYIIAVYAPNKSVCLRLYVYEETPDAIMDMEVHTGGNSLNLFKSGDLSSQVIARIPDLMVVKLLSQGNTWCKVKYNDYTGYVQSRYLFDLDTLNPPNLLPTPTPAPDTGDGALSGPVDGLLDGNIYRVRMYTYRADGQKTVLYAENSTSSQILGEYSNGLLTFSEMKIGEWSYVTVDGKNGYMLTAHLSNTQIGSGSIWDNNPTIVRYVNSGNDQKVHLRAKASTASASYGLFASGTKLMIQKQVNSTWAYVTMESGRVGYMMSKFITASTPAGAPVTPMPALTPTPAGFAPGGVLVVRTGNDGKLILREKPSTSSKALSRYPNGTAVTVYDVAGDWVHVHIAGKTGYMMRTFLAENNPVQTPTPQVTPTITPVPTSAETSPPDASQSPAPTATPMSASPLMEGSTAYVQTGNSGKLNLRVKASASSATVDRFISGTQVSIIKISGVWAQVRVGKKTGYMMLQYLSSSASAPAPSNTMQTPPAQDTLAPADASGGDIRYVQTGNSGKLHLRAQANTSAVSRGLYENGTQVTLVSTSGKWAYVRVNGQAGYMLLEFLASSAP